MSPNPTKIDKLISQTAALSWNDLNLEPAIGPTTHFSNLVLIGRLISSKPLNKHIFHATIKTVWSLVIGLTTEDIDFNTFLFTFATYQEKGIVLANRLWNVKGFHMVLRN
ncbi:hypothetical protein I3760_01G098700 [Carya illinoinensis]|nr:hypothetical protein I3760_01G098700 [Carya illinoinensis]